VQITPFPVYPELHAQVKLPGMFAQVAVPTAQLLDPDVHSSISENWETKIVYLFFFETWFLLGGAATRATLRGFNHLTNLCSRWYFRFGVSQKVAANPCQEYNLATWYSVCLWMFSEGCNWLNSPWWGD